jgi:hypothetical protein
VTEVASYELNRLHGVSNLNAFSDGLRVLRTIAIERWGNLVDTGVWRERQSQEIERCLEHDWPHHCPATVVS